MRRTASFILLTLLVANLPIVRGAPSLTQNSFAQYQRTTISASGVLSNGTFEWQVLTVSGQPPLAKVEVVNNQSSRIINFTYYIDVSTRVETPSYNVAYQNPSTLNPSVGVDHATKTFFWIDPNPPIGSIVETVLGTAFVNGTGTVRLHSGVIKSCWILVSQSLGTGGSFLGTSNATLTLWYDQQTGLLVKLDSEAQSSAGFGSSSDVFLLNSTNVVSLYNPPTTLSAVEWASLTLSILALVLSGIAVAVAMDLRQFRRRKTKESP